MKRYTLVHFAFFRFLFTFSMAHWEAVRVPHLHFQFSLPMPFTPLFMQKSELLMDVFLCLLSFVFTSQIEFSECCV